MFNKIFALLAIIILLPLIILVSFLIIIKDGFPIFFRQNRIGLNGKKFKIYKFRTMIKNSEEILLNDKRLYKEYVNNGFKIDSKIDPRILPFGHFLRSSSIDEIPQFFNVLLNDMNVVGPRPVVEKEVHKLYGQNKHYYLSMKPGITGLWQVSGRSDTTDEERVYLDIEYYNKRSLMFDINIILKTVVEVFKRTGAY